MFVILEFPDNGPIMLKNVPIASAQKCWPITNIGKNFGTHWVYTLGALVGYCIVLSATLEILAVW